MKSSFRFFVRPQKDFVEGDDDLHIYMYVHVRESVLASTQGSMLSLGLEHTV